MEVTYPIIRTLIDTTTTPGYIYIGEAPVSATEEESVWTISKVSTTDPYSINYGRSEAGGNIEKKLKNKWTDRVSLTY